MTDRTARVMSWGLLALCVSIAMAQIVSNSRADARLSALEAPQTQPIEEVCK